mmetsp:Transcript_14474/g.40798  ORF Transcript_14474/g.40798 Transcript_14474/m.40798 type:complete len:224 (+) Transcript_14474:507-1178(+)
MQSDDLHVRSVLLEKLGKLEVFPKQNILWHNEELVSRARQQFPLAGFGVRRRLCCHSLDTFVCKGVQRIASQDSRSHSEPLLGRGRPARHVLLARNPLPKQSFVGELSRALFLAFIRRLGLLQLHFEGREVWCRGGVGGTLALCRNSTVRLCYRSAWVVASFGHQVRARWLGCSLPPILREARLSRAVHVLPSSHRQSRLGSSSSCSGWAPVALCFNWPQGCR